MTGGLPGADRGCTPEALLAQNAQALVEGMREGGVEPYPTFPLGGPVQGRQGCVGSVLAAAA